MPDAATPGADLAGRLDLAPEVRLVPAAFHERYGYDAAGVWRAPGSVTLLSDGDASLTIATRWGTIVAAHARGDDEVEFGLMNRPAERLRTPLAAIGPSGDWAAAGLSAVWALRSAGYALGGVTMLAGVDLPDGVGLGASTATACAVAVALRDMYAPELPTTTLADLVSRGLRAFGVTGEREAGRCRAALLGRTGAALLDDGSAAGVTVPFPVEAAGLRLAVVDTRIRTSPAAPVAERSPLTDATLTALAEATPAALGEALSAAHAELRAAGLPDRAQETVVRAAMDAGALGARMIWDGPGRPALLLLHAEDLAAVRTAVTGTCVTRGLCAPRFLTVTPVAAAVRK